MTLNLNLRSWGFLILRIGVTSMLATYHGWGKFRGALGYTLGGQGGAETLWAFGFPFPTFFAICAALAEFIGCLLVALGLFTRFAAGLIVITMSVAVYYHLKTDLGFELAGLYLLSGLFFVLAGPGNFSLDHLRSREPRVKAVPPAHQRARTMTGLKALDFPQREGGGNMFDSTRRLFLQQTGIGLATLGASGLILRSDAKPTLAVNNDESAIIKIQMGPTPKDPIAAKAELKKITPLPYGPFYRAGAPFRGKLSVPGEPGTTFVLSGRVWAYDTRRPLPGVVLDFWHVDMTEKYSNGMTDLRNRGRLVSSETGYYELESIRPVPYRPNPTGAPDFWRCAHFHLLAVCPGYQPLITEIHFQGDPKKSDPMYRPENAIVAEQKKANGVAFESGVFDLVLERESGSKS